MQCCRFNVVLWVYAMHNMHLLNKLRHKHVGSEYSSFNGCYHSVGLGFIQGWFRIDLGLVSGSFPTSLCGVLVFGSVSRRLRPLPSAFRLPPHSSHNLLTHNLSSHNLLTHNLSSHILSSHILSSHNLLTHTHFAHTHLVLTQLVHTQLALTDTTLCGRRGTS